MENFFSQNQIKFMLNDLHFGDCTLETYQDIDSYRTRLTLFLPAKEKNGFLNLDIHVDSNISLIVFNQRIHQSWGDFHPTNLKVLDGKRTKCRFLYFFGQTVNESIVKALSYLESERLRLSSILSKYNCLKDGPEHYDILNKSGYYEIDSGKFPTTKLLTLALPCNKYSGYLNDEFVNYKKELLGQRLTKHWGLWYGNQRRWDIDAISINGHLADIYKLDERGRF